MVKKDIYQEIINQIISDLERRSPRLVEALEERLYEFPILSVSVLKYEKIIKNKPRQCNIIK